MTREETTPFETIAASGEERLILLCDHAGNAFPEGYGTLGLPAGQLARHIAYDIGAASVTRGLARRLGAAAVLTRYSRLLIDPNRGEDDPTLVMRLSDGAIVPGNRTVDATEIDRRVRLYHRPYHEEIARQIDDRLARGIVPILFSIHSFTDNWKGVPRSWHAAILWDRDPRLARPLIDMLKREGDLTVGDNEPYHGALKGDCMHRHGTVRGLAHAIIEIRQDLIGDAAGEEGWTERLSAILQAILDDPALTGPMAKVRHYGSWSDGAGGTEQAGEDASALEAAAFRRLVTHLQTRSDVQNIDLMNLAGFCRNCLARWYEEAAAGDGHPIGKEAARERIYGMPYEDWRRLHQSEASAEKKAAFEKAVKAHG